eukprot:4544597-Alexandrium_andersonii.AAC.1
MQESSGLRVRLVLGHLPGETRRGRTARAHGLQRPLSPPSRALALHLPPLTGPARRRRLSRRAPGPTRRHQHVEH